MAEPQATPARRVRPFPLDRLARVAMAQVAAGRVLAAHLPLVSSEARERAAALLGGPFSVEIVDTYAFASRELLERLPGPPAPALVRIAAPSGRYALLALDAALALALARRRHDAPNPAPDPRAPPTGEPPLDAAGQRALVTLLEPLLADVHAHVDGFPHDDAELLPLFPDPHVLALDARVRTPVGDGWARLLLPDRLRLAVPRAHRLAAIAPRASRLHAAAVPLVIELGRTRLTRAELASLAPADVVLFEEFGPRPPFGGPLHLRLGRGAFRAHLDGEGLTVLSPFSLGAPRMQPKDEAREHATGAAGASEPGPGATDAARDALLRELPVEVVCELGRVTVSGRELLELLPGTVLPVGRPLAGPVDLTVGGRVVARGELVDVEGEIGVRVTQLFE